MRISLKDIVFRPLSVIVADIDRQRQTRSFGYLTAANFGETSAVRAAERNTAVTAILSAINTNLAQLKSRGCPAYPHTISRSNFVVSALECQRADFDAQMKAIVANPLDPLQEMKSRIDAAGGVHPSQKAGNSTACDRSKWKRK